MKKIFIFLFLLLLPLASAFADLPDIPENPGEPDFSVPVPPPQPEIVDGGAGGGGGGSASGGNVTTVLNETVPVSDGTSAATDASLDDVNTMTNSTTSSSKKGVLAENNLLNPALPTAMTFLWAGIFLVVVLVFVLLLFVRKKKASLPRQIKGFK